LEWWNVSRGFEIMERMWPFATCKARELKEFEKENRELV
jgi:hypothetical protein